MCPVIQAIGRPDFEDGLRAGTVLEVISDTHSVCTNPKAPLAKNADQCDHRASADAESVRNDLPRAPCPQDILKVRPPNSLDYRVRYDTPANARVIQPKIFSSQSPKIRLYFS